MMILRKEDVLKRYDKEIAEEKKRRENVLASMVYLYFHRQNANAFLVLKKFVCFIINQTGPIRSRYEKTKIDSEKFQQRLDSMQAQIEQYKSKMEGMRQVAIVEIILNAL
jgi:hypothetical protein